MLPSDDQLDKLSSQVAQIMTDMTDESIAVIAKRIGELGDATATEAHVLARLAEQQDIDEITRIMAEKAALAETEVTAIFERLADANDEWARVYYEAAGVTPYMGWRSSPVVSALVAQAAKEASDNALNLSKTAAFSYGGNVHTVQSAYNDVINRSIASLSLGTQTHQTVVRKAMQDLAQSGLRAVEYEPGSHAADLASKGMLSVKYPSGRTVRLDSAVRMNVMDGFRGTMAQIREAQGREFGADGYEISVHGLCAPDHQDIQGKQYSIKDFERLNGSLMRPLGTMNCKHIKFPIILGVSEPNYTASELEGMKNYANEQVTWTGLSGKPMTATRYDATQYQRQLEAGIRLKKSEAAAYKAAGMDLDATRATTQARFLQNRYRAISGEMGLRTHSWRTGEKLTTVKKLDDINMKPKSVKAIGVRSVQTSEQLKQYMKSTYGDKFVVDDRVLTYSNIGAVREAINGVETVISDFPEIKGFWSSMESAKHGIMAINKDGKMYFNPYHFDTLSNDEALAGFAEQVASGKWVKNTGTFKGAGIHEGGHLAVGALRTKLYPPDEVLGIYLADYDRDRLDTEIVSAACKVTKRHPDYRGKTNQQIIGELSDYARNDNAETVAEAFKDYYTNGKSALEFSKAVVAEVKRRFEEVA